MDQPTLRISEIYRSIQGETSWAGLPFVFVRLGGCHLRCVYCDSEYALTGGDPMPIDEVLNIVETYACDCVLITGGEPLLQPEVHPLISQLCDRGKTVLIETSGACDISPCDSRAIIILDLKTPGSGMEEHNCWENISKLRPQDEIKFVIMDRADYEWAREVIRKHCLSSSFLSILDTQNSKNLQSSTRFGTYARETWYSASYYLFFSPT